MATSYTSLLGLALPVTGELAGTWGDTVNNAITSLLDTAIAGTTTLSTDADVTLTSTTGASNQARQAILLCSGARTALRTITAPAQSKIYVVINNTTGGFGVKLVGAGPTTGITVAAGKTAVLVWNGSDFVEVAPATATTATNLAGGAAGSVPYQTGAGATTFLSIGTNNFVLTSNGAAPVWTTNTGTGNVVRATSPTLTTPTLGVATATSINKVAITAPATGSTLAIADGKTLTASNTLTLTGTDGSSVAFGTGGTVTYASNNLSVFAATTSAQLAGVISDETGSGPLVFGTSPTIATPTITTSATVPLLIGGTGTTSTLTLRSTSGVGATGADIIFQTGNNGATEAMRVLNSGNVGIGTNAPGAKLDVNGSLKTGYIGATSAIATQLSASGAGYLSYTSGATYLSSFADNVGNAAVLAFNTGNSERMRIDTNGNVGIGTASPVAKLDIQGTGAVAAVLNQRTDVTSLSAALMFKTAGFNYWAMRQSSGALTWYQDTAVGGTTTEYMRIDSSGKVGIGTNSPAQLLHIASGDATALIENTAATSNATLQLKYPSRTWALANRGADLSGAFAIRDTTAGADRLIITSTGNVGIGTATPVNKLQINGSLGRNAPVTKTGNFTLADTENWLICNGTATITVTLPAASSWTGREVMIKTIAAFTVVSASSNVVPLAGGAAGTAILAATAGAWATLVSDGTNWIIMQA